MVLDTPKKESYLDLLSILGRSKIAERRLMQMLNRERKINLLFLDLFYSKI
jgi:hypothetical protein